MSETWSHWCLDQNGVSLPTDTPRCPDCGALNYLRKREAGK